MTHAPENNEGSSKESQSAVEALFGHSGAEGPDVRKVVDVAATAAQNAAAQVAPSRVSKVTDYADDHGNILAMPRGFVVGATAVVLVSLTVIVSAIYFLFFSNVRIDDITFTDPALHAYAAEHFDPDGNGKMSRDEVAAVTEMTIDGLADSSNLEVFSHVETLTLTGDNLISFALPNSPTLKSLDCHGMESLREINVKGCSKLEFVDVSGTSIRTIDLAGTASLREIVCDDDVVIRNMPISAERASA